MTVESSSAAMVLALTLRDRLKGSTAYSAADIPAQRPGIIEPGASFDVTDADGRRFRVIVSRQA